MDETLHDWNMRSRYCHYIFLAGDKLIVSESPSDRGVKATVRKRSDLK